jgi:hypothetical protein
MISLPAGARVWLATGHTDMRKGLDGLALLVQETLKRNPHTGHLFRVPPPARLVDKGAVARRSGYVPVREAARARAFCLAIDRRARRCRSNGEDHAGAAGIFVGRDRLAFAAASLAPASGRLTATL